MVRKHTMYLSGLSVSTKTVELSSGREIVVEQKITAHVTFGNRTVEVDLGYGMLYAISKDAIKKAAGLFNTVEPAPAGPVVPTRLLTA